MMKNKNLIKYFCRITISFAVVYFLSIPGCASREKEPMTLADSTIYYASKTHTESFKGISLSNKLSRKTGKPIKPGTTFVLDEKAKLYAFIENDFSKDKELLFHVDWIDSSGNSFYRKQVEIAPDDSMSSIVSSISISPQKRDKGSYSVRLYLFRELIAEKNFKLLDSADYSKIVEENIKPKEKQSAKKDSDKKIQKVKKETEQISADILLCRKISKKTGKPIGAGTEFTINEKAKVKAVVSFNKPDVKTNEQMKFYFEWIGPDGKVFYKKRIVYTTSIPNFSLTNSISISPEKRMPGVYEVQIIYKKKIIAKKNFELISHQ